MAFLGKPVVPGWSEADIDPILAGYWYYLAGVFDPDIPALSSFRNGIQIARNTAVGSVLDSSLNSAHIGTPESRLYIMNGTVDEIRISEIARSGQWLLAQFYSMTDQMVRYDQE